MFGGFREREDNHSWKARKEGMRQKRLFLISLARMFFCWEDTNSNPSWLRLLFRWVVQLPNYLVLIEQLGVSRGFIKLKFLQTKPLFFFEVWWKGCKRKGYILSWATGRASWIVQVVGSVMILFVLFLNMCAYIHTVYYIVMRVCLKKKKWRSWAISTLYTYIYIHLYECIFESLSRYKKMKERERERHVLRPLKTSYLAVKSQALPLCTFASIQAAVPIFPSHVDKSQTRVLDGVWAFFCWLS